MCGSFPCTDFTHFVFAETGIEVALAGLAARSVTVVSISAPGSADRTTHARPGYRTLPRSQRKTKNQNPDGIARLLKGYGVVLRTELVMINGGRIWAPG